jgi:GR25 family glycosyltransferase involved in LPS biosynthesis
VEIYLINLDRSTDRLREFGAVNAHLGSIHRFPAVDGSALSMPNLIERKLVEPGIGAFYSMGALGNAFSHLTLWERISSQTDAVTICEDDAIFHRDFRATSERLLAGIPPDWDIVMWGWNYDSPLEVGMPGLTTAVLLCDYDGVQLKTATFQSYPVSPVLLPLRQAFGLACYSISPNGARKLRNYCIPIRPMSIPCRGAKGGNVPNIGLDLMMSSAFRHMKSFVSMTPLVLSTNEWSRSTVRGLKTQTIP